MTLLLRFWTKVDRRDSDLCWEWISNATSNGYGVFYFDRELGRQKAHRVSFWIKNGYWPDVCRHKCDNRLCVNPSHLENGTYLDNIQDAVKRGRVKNHNTDKTFCKRGHPLFGPNLYTYKNGNRLCRKCNNASRTTSRTNNG